MSSCKYPFKVRNHRITAVSYVCYLEGWHLEVPNGHSRLVTHDLRQLEIAAEVRCERARGELQEDIT
jgi:hypothetical protein